jgi:serine/threonine protein kinase|uniref:Protein kinase domain-containing protein n=1 Tax=Fagus sylvatica TaxID=28930 RepID=A0A2N9HA15_FAGSY
MLMLENRGLGRTPLDWSTRLKLALVSTQGLAFLHCYNKAKLFHGHLTSSNILVDHLGNACLADIGLHQLFSTTSSSHNANKAPELMLNNNIISQSQRNFTQKSDVYSFGVILLEILTGRMAMEEGDMSLVKWVQSVAPAREEWTWEVIDFELLVHKEMGVGNDGSSSSGFALRGSIAKRLSQDEHCIG